MTEPESGLEPAASRSPNGNGRKKADSSAEQIEKPSIETLEVVEGEVVELDESERRLAVHLEARLIQVLRKETADPYGGLPADDVLYRLDNKFPAVHFPERMMTRWRPSRLTGMLERTDWTNWRSSRLKLRGATRQGTGSLLALWGGGRSGCSMCSWPWGSSWLPSASRSWRGSCSGEHLLGLLGPFSASVCAGSRTTSA